MAWHMDKVGSSKTFYSKIYASASKSKLFTAIMNQTPPIFLWIFTDLFKEIYFNEKNIKNGWNMRMQCYFDNP